MHSTNRLTKDYSRDLYTTRPSPNLTIVISQLNKVDKLQTIFRNLNWVPTVYHSRYWILWNQCFGITLYFSHFENEPNCIKFIILQLEVKHGKK